MRNSSKQKASDLKGRNIFQDPKRGTILYDPISKRGYQLTSKEVSAYTLSKAFLSLAIIIVYACYAILDLSLILSLVIGVVGYVFMKVIFKIRVLNTLPVIENYQRPNNGNFFKNSAERYTYKNLILMIALSAAFIGVTIYYINTTTLGKPEIIGFIILLGATGITLLFSIIVLIVKKSS